MTTDDLYLVLKKMLLLFVGLVLLLFFVYLARTIILFFFLAFFTAVAINPIVNFLEKRGISRRIGAILTIIAIIAGVTTSTYNTPYPYSGGFQPNSSVTAIV